MEAADSSLVSNIGYEGGRGMAYVNLVIDAFVWSEVPGSIVGSLRVVAYVSAGVGSDVATYSWCGLDCAC